MKKIIYVVLDSIFFPRGKRKYINKTAVRFPFSNSRYYPKKYEPAKQDFIEKYAKGISVDLGAHIGLYAVLLSKVSSKVIAFEPTLDSRLALEKTLKLNNCKNVIVRSEVVTDLNGKIDFFETGDKISNANSILEVGCRLTKNSVNLDDIEEQIDFLKMDVEGSELLVLRGASQKLQYLKYISLEIHPSLLARLGQSVDEIFKVLNPYEPEYFYEGKQTDIEYLLNLTSHYEVNVILRANLKQLFCN